MSGSAAKKPWCGGGSVSEVNDIRCGNEWVSWEVWCVGEESLAAHMTTKRRGDCLKRGEWERGGREKEREGRERGRESSTRKNG